MCEYETEREIGMNKVIIIGKLQGRAEVRHTNSGKAVCFFSLEVSHRTKVREEIEEIDCVAWDELAERIGSDLAQGRRLAVDGRLHSREYVAPGGTARKVTEVVAKNVEFLDVGA